MAAAGVVAARDILKEAEATIAAHDETEIDYIAIVDPDTLLPVDTIAGMARMIMAVRVGKTRLIDNMALVAAS
jgi:pantoate--beta-alanine ligase